jgi:hypothetical protein
MEAGPSPRAMRWSSATAAALVLVLLSGCSGSGSGSGSGVTEVEGVVTADFSEVEVKVGADRGAIRGVVVDPSITPIPGASVTVAADNRTSTTDQVGRFVFDDLRPGTYFLHVRKDNYHPTQVSVEVEAGVAEPPIVKVQLQPLFDQKPFVQQVTHKGFFTCSQAGASPIYSSSNCVTDPCPRVMDPSDCNGLPSKALDNVTSQEREWHSDVGPGWQSLVFEMTWEPTSQGTSARLGMVVSTYKPERDPAHSFANVASAAPLRIQLDLGVEHESAATVEPVMVPEEGLQRMSYFVSVRPPEGSVCAVLCAPPGAAVNQDFQVVLSQFYYGKPPEGWSFVRGDPLPF